MRRFFVVAATLISCGPSKGANEPRTCNDLGEGFAFHPQGMLAKYDEKVSLTPPRGFRIDRAIPGKAPVHCETQLYPCEKEGGGKNVNTAADVAAALAHPEVRLALAQNAQFGEIGNGGNVGGLVDVFSITHGKERLEIGRPCPTPAGMCRPVPPPVQHAMDVLMNVYDHHKGLSCSTLPEG